MNDTTIKCVDFYIPKPAPGIGKTVQPEKPIKNNFNKWISYIYKQLKKPS